MRSQRRVAILMADDDEDDCLLVGEALSGNRFVKEFRFVRDGQELMDDLEACKKPRTVPVDGHSCCPDLILLDLNMPRKNGMEALEAIKSDPSLKHLPVVILTTSTDERQIYLSYQLGANSFITKPDSYEVLVEYLRMLIEFWARVSSQPNGNGERSWASRERSQPRPGSSA